ncbi:MAG: hypothetical protein WAV90_07245, partial [Gordonia amarae]
SPSPLDSVAAAMSGLADAAREQGADFTAVRAALVALSMLDEQDWSDPVAITAVRGGVCLSWRHIGTRDVDGVTRQGGSYSVTVTDGRALFLRSKPSSPTAESDSAPVLENTAVLIAGFHRTGMFPAEAAALTGEREAGAGGPETDANPAQALVNRTGGAGRGVRYFARWWPNTGDVRIESTAGEAVYCASVGPSAEDVESAIASQGFTTRGGWDSVFGSDDELRVSVAPESKAAA